MTLFAEICARYGLLQSRNLNRGIPCPSSKARPFYKLKVGGTELGRQVDHQRKVVQSKQVDLIEQVRRAGPSRQVKQASLS